MTVEDVDRGWPIDAQRCRAVIAEIDKTLAGIRERLDKSSDEYDRIIARAEELDHLRSGLNRQLDRLLTQKTWWVEELANAPASPPESLGEAIDKLMEDDPAHTTEQLIGKLDPLYFPDGIGPNQRRTVSMHRRWSLERLGLWKSNDNRGGHTAAHNSGSGGPG